MKWFTYISSLIIITFVCSAHGCNEEIQIEETQRSISTARDSIKEAFASYEPDDFQLRAFEETAKQRLLDFADYLKIASDDSIDIAFRKQASEMAGSLFLSTETKITGLLVSDTETISEILAQCTSSLANYNFVPADLRVFKSLSRKNDSVYSGSISFSLKKGLDNIQSKPGNSQNQFTADIYVIKKEKYFGKERLSVWEVFLGDIKILP